MRLALLHGGGLRRVVVITLAFTLVAAVAGALWEAVWTPPAGVAYQDMWFLEPTGPDVSVSGSALYVLIAAIVGIVVGVGAGVLPRHEHATLLGVLVGAGVGALVMYYVGHALGPADPQQLAVGQPDLEPIPGDLVVASTSESGNPLTSTVLLAMPIGAMTGLAVVYLLGRRPSVTVTDSR